MIFFFVSNLMPNTIFSLPWYLAMPASDSVGTILAHPDKGRLWGGTEWLCSGGLLRHLASHLLFCHMFCFVLSTNLQLIILGFLSLCEASVGQFWGTTQLPQCGVMKFIICHYLSLSGWFRGFPQPLRLVCWKTLFLIPKSSWYLHWAGFS